jgi:hypothetical protein
MDEDNKDDIINFNSNELSAEEKRALEKEAKTRKLFQFAESIKKSLQTAVDEQNPALNDLPYLSRVLGVPKKEVQYFLQIMV